MFTIIEGLPENVIGIEVAGLIRESDYLDVFLPEVEERLAKNSKPNFLCIIRSSKLEMTVGAMWQDFKTALKYWNNQGKVAIVTDIPWIEQLTKVYRKIAPGEIKVFKLWQEPEAVAWVIS